MIDGRAFRSGFAGFVLFTVLAGDAWRYSIGWIGFGVVAAAIVAVSLIMLIRGRAHWRVGRLPYPLLGFAAVAVASIAWSHYPGFTALGALILIMTVLVGACLAILCTWNDLLESLGVALKTILGLSILFELIVAVVIRHPVFPLVPAPGIDYSSYETVPKLLYWSRNELFEVFEGGRIQGIVGNSSLLGFVGVLSLIVFGVQLLTDRRRWVPTSAWLALAAVTILFTRSATITVGLVVISAALVAVLLVRRARTSRARSITYWFIGAAMVASIGGAILLRGPLLAALGKSDDLTGRLTIWERVIGLAAQRPIGGWGWLGYWIPWIDPFDTLVTRSGVLQLHAHNAWIDVWFQLGVIGLVVFAALVLSTAVRSWFFATDRPIVSPRSEGNYSSVSVLPLLILAALLVQSLAESRLLVEYGMLLLAVIAIKTRAAEGEPLSAPPDLRPPSGRSVPQSPR